MLVVGDAVEHGPEGNRCHRAGQTGVSACGDVSVRWQSALTCSEEAESAMSAIFLRVVGPRVLGCRVEITEAHPEQKHVSELPVRRWFKSLSCVLTARFLRAFSRHYMSEQL